MECTGEGDKNSRACSIQEPASEFGLPPRGCTLEGVPRLPEMDSVFFGYLDHVLDVGERILEFQGRFWNSRLVPELWALFQNSRGCLRSLGCILEFWDIFQNSGGLLESWAGSLSFASWTCLICCDLPVHMVTGRRLPGQQ